MIVRPVASLRQTANRRPPGYLEDCLAAGTLSPDGETVSYTAEQYAALVFKYRPPPVSPPKHGPGTELKALLAKFGIHASPTCGCNAMARKMDAWGPDESLKHIEEIVDVMEETAKKRNMPFLRSAAKLLVRRAISKSRAMISKGEQ